MDAEFVTHYLAHLFPEARDVHVRELRRSFPGISRETWLLDAGWDDGQREVRRGFVFRMDTPGGSIVPLPLRREYEVYRRLQGTSVPVARVYRWEDDPAWLCDGREFVLREKVDGTMNPTGAGEGGPGELVAAREHASRLAAIHTLDWKALGFEEVFEAPPSVEQSAAFDLAVWERLYREHTPEPMPAATRVIAWLRDNPPPPAPRLSLLKGNSGIGEEIWQGSTIVAMSDWELAHIGDPAEDFAWIQGFDSPGTREAMLEHYAGLTGIRISPESIAYYSAFRAFKAFVCLQAGANMFIARDDLRVQLASLSLFSFQSLEALSRRAL